MKVSQPTLDFDEKSCSYDKNGRMYYHPDYHYNHGTKFSEEDLEYLCKFYETDGLKSISMALGRTEKTIVQKIAQLKRNGKFQYYKNLNKHW